MSNRVQETSRMMVDGRNLALTQPRIMEVTSVPSSYHIFSLDSFKIFECFPDVFRCFVYCLEALGVAQIHADAFGCVTGRSDTFGRVRTHQIFLHYSESRKFV